MAEPELPLRPGSWGTPISPEPFEPSTPEAILPWQDKLDAIKASEPPVAIQQARRNEDEAMRKRFPGEYVAYTESESTAQREILAHAPNLKTVRDALAHLPDAQMNAVRVAYCDAPARTFRGGYD